MNGEKKQLNKVKVAVKQGYITREADIYTATPLILELSHTPTRRTCAPIDEAPQLRAALLSLGKLLAIIYSQCFGPFLLLQKVIQRFERDDFTAAY